MISLLLLSLLSQAEPVNATRVLRIERTPGLRVLGRNKGGSLPAVGFARSGDTRGMTAECACTQPSLVLASGATSAVTTTRATSAYCTKADYSLTLCPANTARMMTGGGSGMPLGILHEYLDATNQCLQNSDLSNAAWVKVNATCLKNAVDPAGVANGASTCTATAGNGTVLQTVAVTGQYANSLYIKRGTGTGTVSVTVDGVTWFDITSRLSSTVHRRVVNTDTIGCANGGCIIERAMAASFASSPVLGIRLGTSGDSVIISKAQTESGIAQGFFSTSPIDTTTVAVVRNGELHSATVPAFTPQSSSYYEVVTGSSFKYGFSSSAQRDTNNEFNAALDTSYGPLTVSPFCMFVNGGVVQELYSTEKAPTIGPIWASCANNGTTITANLAGAVTTAAATVQPATLVTTIWLGARAGGAGSGVLSNLCLDLSPTKCAATQNVAANAIVWIGDSISAGSVSAPTMPPAELQRLTGKVTYNKGIPGCNTNFCANNYTNNVRGKNYSSLVYGCGTNNTIGGGGAPDGVAAWNESVATLNQALSDGLKVVTFNILPYGGAPGWDTNKQAAIDAYNALWQAWCTTNAANPKLVCVNAYASFGGQGGDPKVMLTIYDSGDGRHPNALGSAFLATLVAAGNP